MSFEIDLTGRKALVTGAGRHTGRAFSKALAAAGAEVAVNDIVADKAEAVVEEIRAAGGAATAVVFDVTDHEAVHDGVGTFSPDILINNAAAVDATITWPPVNFQDTTPESWRMLVDVNLYGQLNCTHAALPGMTERGWGRVISIISDASRRGERGLAVYGAAKGAVAAFIRNISVEGGRDGITANCIAFGTLAYEHHGEHDDEMVKRMTRNYAIKRLGTPQDPVGLALLLSSDASSWITGQVIPVNGGYTQTL